MAGRIMVARRDYLRECQGVWQSQLIVPEALRPLIGKHNFIQTTGIRNDGPASRKRAADSAKHLAYVTWAKGKMEQARAILAGHIPRNEYELISSITQTVIPPGQSFVVPAGGRIV